MSNFNDRLTSLLKKDPDFLDEENNLLKNEVVNKAWKADQNLIGLLIEDEQIKAKFFSKIKDCYVFDINTFTDYIQDKHFLNDSYTKYKNKIGLNIDGKFLNERKEVALVWPYKDCILEGGQSKEDQKRKEIFFNEILAQDAIDRLLDPKVFTNFKKYTVDGQQKVTELKRDENGTIKENLIIKGNNLLALHSLKQQFQGKVKLIYIDPPFNTGNDEFKYNDNFNHSTWLTFMKNRLEIARELLKDEGVIFVSLDDKESHYCKIIMDEVFKRENFIVDICHKSRGSISNDKIISSNHNHILLFAKNERLVFEKKTQFGVKKILDSFKLQDEKGLYKLVPVDGPGGAAKGNPHYEFQGITGYWRFSKERMQQMFDEGLVIKTEKGLQQKYYREKALLSKQTVTTWWDDKFLTSSATSSLKKLMGNDSFKNPKNINLLKRIVELWTNDADIVLDFHAGSGTTAHAVLELNKEDGGNRQFILVEQMDYIENVTVERVKKVMQKQSEENPLFKNKTDFIYFELAKYNQAFIDQIQDAKTTDELLKIWEAMKEKSFLNYNVDIKEQDKNIEEFKTFSLNQQKQVLVEMLNKNQLYVNLSEIEDEEFNISNDDKDLNKAFYGEGR